MLHLALSGKSLHVPSTGQVRQNLGVLDQSVYFCFGKELEPSTKPIHTVLQGMDFHAKLGVLPLPVNEYCLCGFVAHVKL